MLIDNADRGFPVHMNLAVPDRNKIANKVSDGDCSNEDENNLLRRLKTQNHQLTEVKHTVLKDFLVIIVK